MELHVWGASKKIALIDPESIAAAWYLNSVLSKNSFTIVTSSNTDLSQSGKLPSLKHNNQTIDGYVNIIRYVSNLDPSYNLDRELHGENLALNNGLLLYLQNNISIITDYALYLNKSNYEKYSRSIFGQFLPFPMQYNTPLQFRARARENCAKIGLTVEDKTEIEEEMLKNVPTVSKVQQMRHESMVEQKLLIKNSVSNMKCLNFLKSQLEIIIQLQNEVGGSKYTFENLNSAELLLLAHLYVQSSRDLPDQFIRTFLDQLYPEYLENKQSIWEELNKNLEAVKIRGPYFSESPNVVNAIRRLIF